MKTRMSITHGRTVRGSPAVGAGGTAKGPPVGGPPEQTQLSPLPGATDRGLGRSGPQNQPEDGAWGGGRGETPAFPETCTQRRPCALEDRKEAGSPNKQNGVEGERAAGDLEQETWKKLNFRQV